MGEVSLARIARARFSFAQSLLIGMLGLGVSAMPTAAKAQPRYSWELSGLESSTDSGGPSDFDVSTFGATYYFDSVDDGEQPYALAAFFDPATRLSLTANQTDASDSWVLSGQYLLDKSRWYLGGRYQRDDYIDDVYGLIAGKYLGPRTTLELAIDTVKQKIGGTLPCLVPPCPTFSDSVRTDTTALSFVHVRNFRSLTYVLSGGFTQQEFPVITGSPFDSPSSFALDTRTVHTYSIRTALYPTKKLGVHIGYDTTDGDFGNDGYSVGARWFFRRNVAFELSLSNLDVDGLPPPYDHRDTRTFRITGRF